MTTFVNILVYAHYLVRNYYNICLAYYLLYVAYIFIDIKRSWYKCILYINIITKLNVTNQSIRYCSTSAAVVVGIHCIDWNGSDITSLREYDKYFHRTGFYTTIYVIQVYNTIFTNTIILYWSDSNLHICLQHCAPLRVYTYTE